MYSSETTEVIKMVETLEDACTPVGAKKWHWYNIERDLVGQGGLERGDIKIDPFSVTDHNCGGEYRGNRFAITWVPDTFLLVSAKEYIPQLIGAFAKVVEYKPFARYRKDGLVTTEWDKVDPEGRYKKLQEKGELELTRLIE